MNDRLREAQYVGTLHLREIDWQFRVYLMKGDANEVVDTGFLFANLSEKIRVIAAEYLSSEFKYLRSGFALAHYGRRGVTYSLWHWGDWQGTWEYFCQAWYCYGRAIEGMTPLDRTEPIMCQHEVDIVMKEALMFREIAFRSSTHEALILDYRDKMPEQVAHTDGLEPLPAGTLLKRDESLYRTVENVRNRIELAANPEEG